VAVTGIIGFVGLIAPHVARRLAKTPDNRVILPLSVLCGALMTLWSDTIARLALGGDALPVGVITAFLGAPFFAYLLRQERV
jgi:iron complex transport system permease protein